MQPQTPVRKDVHLRPDVVQVRRVGARHERPGGVQPAHGRARDAPREREEDLRERDSQCVQSYVTRMMQARTDRGRWRRVRWRAARAGVDRVPGRAHEARGVDDGD